MAGPAPLAFLRVTDRSAGVAGRYAARLFAMLGAEVVRDRGGNDALLGRGGEGGRAFGRWLDAGKVTHPSRAAGDELVIGGIEEEVRA